jgi:hypothetical protein
MSETISDSLTVVDGSGRKVFEFDAGFAVLDLGAQGNEGDLRIRGDDGEFRFHFDGGRQLMILRDGAGRAVLQFDGARSLLDIGAQGNEGDIFVRDSLGATSIHLDGGSGDITLRNADCAEEFESAEVEAPRPGSVVVLGSNGAVSPCSVAYDRTVAGIVSGAGDFQPAIVLGRSGTGTGVPVALMGKVRCLVDASVQPVHVGDLLTTSTTRGHAMKATEPERMVGAVVGKALHPLSGGTGLVPVLVSLQ